MSKQKKAKTSAPKQWQKTKKIAFKDFKLYDVQLELDCKTYEWKHIDSDGFFPCYSLTKIQMKRFIHEILDSDVLTTGEAFHLLPFEPIRDACNSTLKRVLFRKWRRSHPPNWRERNALWMSSSQLSGPAGSSSDLNYIFDATPKHKQPLVRNVFRYHKREKKLIAGSWGRRAGSVKQKASFRKDMGWR